MSSYSPRPDVLDLIFELKPSVNLEIRQPASAFGTVETEVLYFKNQPLGVVTDLMPYHSAVGVFAGSEKVILLSSSQELFPGAADPFPQALQDLLSSELLEWTLVCERNCEQEDLPRFAADSPEADRAVADLFRFLKNEADVACPTFLVTRGRNEVRGASLPAGHT